MSRWKRGARWLLPVLIVLAVLFTHPFWLAAAGRFLVAAETPVKSDALVVLAGDFTGNRILKACELVRGGYAPVALVSGPSRAYGYHESELAISFAVKKGCSPEWFVGFPSEALSTRDEAALLIPELRRRGVKRYLLVTSDFHTRRAGGLFRAAGRDLEMHVVAAPDVDFSAERWWRSRQGRKVFAFEWLKTVTEWFGI